MKILLLGEFSGLHNELKSGLLKLGHNVTLAASNDFFKKYPVDIDLGSGSNVYTYKLRQLLNPLLNLGNMTGFDVVHLVSPYIIPRILALNLYIIKFLKENNKIVTLSAAGTDPFFVAYSEKTMRYSPIPWNEKFDRNGRLHYMRRETQLNSMKECAEVVDRIIPIMYEYYSTFCEAGYKAKTMMPIPIPIDAKKHNISNDFGQKKLGFFHGLNKPGFKGTFLIESAFSRLQKKYPNDVECIIAGKMPFNDYLEVLTKTNISVDQVFSYSLAMNALYSMAQGKVVCGGAEAESSILYQGELPPVYNLQPDENFIFEVFERILASRTDLESKAYMSRRFVERHHDSLRVAEKYVECWNSI